MTQSAPAVAPAAPDADAFVAPPYQDINTRRAPWPRLIDHHGKTPVLRLAGAAGEIDLLPLAPERDFYAYGLYRLARRLTFAFTHWREEARTTLTGQPLRLAVFETQRETGLAAAFEVEMTEGGAPRCYLNDRASGTRIDVSAHVMQIAPHADDLTRPSLISLAFARRSEQLLSDPAYGLKPGTSLRLWFGSLL